MSKRKTTSKKATVGKVTVRSGNSKITDRDRKMAQVCVKCPVCKHARKKQKGAAFWFVKKIEGRFCPFCQAHERVYGRKAHQPIW